MVLLKIMIKPDMHSQQILYFAVVFDLRSEKWKKTTRGNKICLLKAWWNRERTQSMEIRITRDKSESYIFYERV